MVSSNKILTVSYGTFSCTAEGYEDPLEVVKEATHFFRGVVGEDRFFGAEPPQFDPELASEYLRDRLADGTGAGGTLSLGSPPRVMAAAASAGAMAAAMSRPAAAMSDVDSSLPDDDTIEATAVLHERIDPAGDTPDPASVAEAPVSDVAAAAATGAGAATLAAKLERIRAVVAQADAEEALEDLAPEPSLEASLDPAPDSAPEEVAEEVADADISADISDDLSDESADDALTAPETAEAPAPEAAPEPEHEPAPEPELDLELDAPDPEEAEEPPVLEADAPLAEAPEAEAAEADLVPGGDSAPAQGQLIDEEDAILVAEAAPEASDADPDLDALLAAMSAEESAPETPDLGALDADPDVDGEDAADTLYADDDLEDADDIDPDLDSAVADLLRETEEPVAHAPEADPEPQEQDAARSGGLAAPFAAATAAVAALVSGSRGKDRAEEDRDDTAFEPHEADATEAALDRAWASEAGPLTPDTAPEVEGAAPARPLRARVVKVKRAAFEEAIEKGDFEEIVEPAAHDTPEHGPDHRPDAAAPEPVPAPDGTTLSPEEEEELARELAAVKAELASDFGAWDEDEDEEAFLDETTPEQADLSAPLRLDNPLPPAADDWSGEADAVAPQGTPVAEEDLPEEVLSSARKAVKLASPARAMLTEREVEDDDTSRLLDQTNSELDEPEGNRRRSAIAHLRAAVAATKADRSMGRSDHDDAQEPYREDLASVVRPRRPQTEGARTARPVSRPAPETAAEPLTLVPENRVADGSAPAAVSVKPRRVQRSRPAEAVDGAAPVSGFASYAQSVGAAELSELLEAAAAYMSFVEGRDQFSRPQLMTTLRQAEVTDSSREDRLRSFGQLLREGKIRKTSGGRFTAAETISFKPDRAANG